MSRSAPTNVVAVLVVQVLLLAGAVFGAATVERNAATHAGKQAENGQRLLTAMLDQETGARGYFETRDTRFLEPWHQGTGDFRVALKASRSLAGDDHSAKKLLDDQVRLAAKWHAATQADIDSVSFTGVRPTVAAALSTKSIMDDFRAVNAAYGALLVQRRDHSLWLATWFAVVVAAGMSLILLSSSLLLARRQRRRDSEFQKTRSQLRELLQVSESEEESRTLLMRHIERVVPESGVAVLIVNNSADRLDVVRGGGDPALLPAADSAHLRPNSCLAVRLSRTYEQRAGDEPLLTCEVCGKIQGDAACEPLLVAGQVIGAVLVKRRKTLPDPLRARVRDSVAQAAPILANQRNLALAEVRAASDALTGLPNRRAADAAIKRMVAHASRSVSPLAAVLMDLDHFKLINDVQGHDSGDSALAAVGQLLSSSLRASDFAARYGGEEFLMLLPDTDRTGALVIAEKLRLAIEQAAVPRAGPITASFGIAILPDDAGDAEQLLRKADRALYSAKDHGRNRVETASG